MFTSSQNPTSTYMLNSLNYTKQNVGFLLRPEVVPITIKLDLLQSFMSSIVSGVKSKIAFLLQP